LTVGPATWAKRSEVKAFQDNWQAPAVTGSGMFLNIFYVAFQRLILLEVITGQKAVSWKNNIKTR
jgi:hypothetical protein